MKSVKVYVPGSTRCDTAEAMVRSAVAKRSIGAEVVKITDRRQIAMAGAISAPGIAVDGKLGHAGGLPDETTFKGRLSA